MKHVKINITTALAVSIWILTASAAPGMPATAAEENTLETVIVVSAIANENTPRLAANEENATAGEPTAPAGPQDRVPESQPGPGNGGSHPSAGTKSPPLKPFKPSEDIAAEQAVDFPVDI